MLEVTAVGYNYVHTNGWEIKRPHGFNHYVCVYIRNAFYTEINGKTKYVDHPAYIIYRPQDPEHFYNKEIPYADNWIHFDGDSGEVEKLMDELGLPMAIPFEVEDNLDNSAIHQLLAAEYRRHGQHHDQIMADMLKIFFYKLSDRYHMQNQKENSGKRSVEGYREAFNILRSRIYQGGEAARIGSVDEVASQMNLSTSYFQHVYKELFGVPVTKDIINARIEYASYLLLNGGFSVAEIGAYCGYDTIEHFNRQFKKIKGCSPTEYYKKNA